MVRYWMYGLIAYMSQFVKKCPSKRSHSERFCDVAVTVKFYCKCDVAKSFRVGPLVKIIP